MLLDQLVALVSRLAGAELTATIGTIAAWVLTAAMVWTVARVFRLAVDTLFRPRRWFSLYVLASVLGILAGALLLYATFVTWDPLAEAPERIADGVLFFSALVGSVFAIAATVRHRRGAADRAWAGCLRGPVSCCSLGARARSRGPALPRRRYTIRRNTLECLLVQIAATSLPKSST